MAIPAETLLRALKAVAEPTRLRMLAVLAAREHSVTELTRIFAQSQPRVSRQLKLLCDAGLLERSRDQHWVYYRAATLGAAGAVVQAVLKLLDDGDLVVGRDLLLAREIASARDAPPPALPADESTADLAAAIPEELGRGPFESLLYAGQRCAALLPALAPLAGRVTGAGSRADDVRTARALLRSLGYRHCSVSSEDPAVLPYAAQSFATVVLEFADGDPARRRASLAEAARVLRDGGRLLLVADYDRFAEESAGRNPLQAARETLAEQGLACLRLRPLDADGRHLLIALALAERAAAAA